MRFQPEARAPYWASGGSVLCSVGDGAEFVTLSEAAARVTFYENQAAAANAKRDPAGAQFCQRRLSSLRQAVDEATRWARAARAAA